MTFTPFPFQLEDVAKLRANNYTGLLNIDPGGTKTAISTLAMKDSGASTILISAPLSTHQTAWGKTFEAITGQEVRRIGSGDKAEKAALADFTWGYPGVYITTPQYLTRADTSDWRGDALIADEIHQGLATPRSRGQRALSGFSAADKEPLSRRFGMRLALSGTPARGAVENLWGVMRFLWPDLNARGEVAAENFWLWQADRQEYKEVWTNQRDQWGNAKKVKQFLGEKVPGSLLAEAPCVVSHFRRERCCVHHNQGFLSLEEPQELEHVVELHPKQRKAIRELEDSYMTYLNDNILVADLSLVQKQRVRQICLGVPEVSTVVVDDVEKSAVNFAEDCVSPFLDETFSILSKLPGDEPVVIYLDSQKFAEVTTKRLNAAGITAAEYSGATVKHRAQYLKDFGTKYRVLVMVSSAGATGTDGLQTVSNTEIILETPVSLTTRIQAESRQDRIGAKGQVQRYRILDSEGYAAGRLSDQLTQRLLLNQSLRSGNA